MSDDIVKRLRAAGHNALMDEAADEIERLRKVRLIADDVVWYDWSNNDSDAVHTMEQLRLTLRP